MSRILSALNTLRNLIMGPLLVGVVILVLYLWLVKPLLFIAGLVALAVIILIAIKIALG